MPKRLFLYVNKRGGTRKFLIHRGKYEFIEDIRFAEFLFAQLRFPIAHRGPIRTSNLLKRQIVEERCRLKINPNAFAEKAALKLNYGAMI